MTAMVRTTVSAPRELIDGFMQRCHERNQSGSEVLREFMAQYVAEANLLTGRSELTSVGGAVKAAACGPRGGDP
jgi:metal-responsive CopG/Arc/MetJ family transcriptional regulator